jgi:uncharacterized membrane protein (TIGR02234 family)
VRREPLLAVLLCVVGAFVVLVGAGRAWTAVDVAAGALSDAQRVGVPGRDVAPGVDALGLVGLAGVVALAATRRLGRVVVGVLLLLTGLGVVASVLAADLTAATLRSPQIAGAGGGAVGDVDVTAWPWVTCAGGVALAAAGLLIAFRGGRWAALGRRYDAPSAQATPSRPAAPAAERDLWEALDRGEDPTAAPGTGPGVLDPEGRGRSGRG